MKVDIFPNIYLVFYPFPYKFVLILDQDIKMAETDEGNPTERFDEKLMPERIKKIQKCSASCRWGISV